MIFWQVPQSYEGKETYCPHYCLHGELLTGDIYTELVGAAVLRSHLIEESITSRQSCGLPHQWDQDFWVFQDCQLPTEPLIQSHEMPISAEELDYRIVRCQDEVHTLQTSVTELLATCVYLTQALFLGFFWVHTVLAAWCRRESHNIPDFLLYNEPRSCKEE